MTSTRTTSYSRPLAAAVALVAAIAALLLVAYDASPAHAADRCSVTRSTTTCTFDTGTSTWTVPVGVTEATFDVFGAQGDSVNRPAGCGAGGFNGSFGSNTGGGGGGASDVRRDTNALGDFALDERIIVAGGGGRGGASGGGGGTSGEPGVTTSEYLSNPYANGGPGGGGTQVAGGSAPNQNYAGGGGGGGGSGFGPDGVVFESGVRSGNGLVTITYATPLDTTAPTLSVSHTPDSTYGWNKTSPVTLNVSASDSGSGLAGAPTCTDGTTSLTLAAGSTAGTWTAPVSGDGTHNISCSVSDIFDNSSGPKTDTVKIDTSAPSTSCSVTPTKLSTAANNHKLLNITASVQVTDITGGSGANGFTLVSVTSNQADSGLARDDVASDIQGWALGTDDKSGQLRAERYGGTRTYTLTYRGYDVVGNTEDCSATVTVPKGK